MGGGSVAGAGHTVTGCARVREQASACCIVERSGREVDRARASERCNEPLVKLPDHHGWLFRADVGYEAVDESAGCRCVVSSQPGCDLARVDEKSRRLI